MKFKEEPRPSDSDSNGMLIEQAMEALKGAIDNFQHNKPWPTCPPMLRNQVGMGDRAEIIGRKITLKSLGQIDRYLGIQITKTEKRFTLSQKEKKMN